MTDIINWCGPIRTRCGHPAKLTHVRMRPQIMGGYAYPMRVTIYRPALEVDIEVDWNYMLNGLWKSNEPGHALDIVNIRWWERPYYAALLWYRSRLALAARRSADRRAQRGAPYDRPRNPPRPRWP